MTRQLHFGLHPYGVGGPGSDGLWKDPRVAKTASVDIDYYIDWAKLAERGLFAARQPRAAVPSQPPPVRAPARHCLRGQS